MKYALLGIRRDMAFKTKEGGNVQGAKLFVTCEDSRVDGVMTDSFFISTTSTAFADLAVLSPGMNIDVLFNRYGKPGHIAVLK